MLFMIASIVFSTAWGQDVVPAHAADLRVFTTRTIELEAEQMTAISAWNSSRQNLRETEILLAQETINNKRAQELKARQVISLEKAALADYKFQKAKADREAAVQEVARDRARVEGAKAKLLAEGNPSEDHRRELVQALIEEKIAEIAIFKQHLAVAELGCKLAKIKLDSGRHLGETISEADRDSRKLVSDMQEQERRSLTSKIASREKTIAGLQKSLSRLP